MYGAAELNREEVKEEANKETSEKDETTRVKKEGRSENVRGNLLQRISSYIKARFPYRLILSKFGREWEGKIPKKFHFHEPHKMIGNY